MAQNKTYKFKLITDVTNFLNGAVLGGQVVNTGGSGSAKGVPVGIPGLVGLTLIFTQPASHTITFVASSGAGGSAASPDTNPDPQTLLFLDIKAQIEAVMTTVTVRTDAEGRLVIVEKTPSAGVTVSKTGTANGKLGFDASVDTVGKLYTPSTVSPATVPAWVWMNTDNNGQIIVSTWE